MCVWVAVLPGGFLALGHRLVQFNLDDGKIVVAQFVQQVALARIQLLTATGELVALEDGHLVSEFFNDRIAMDEYTLLVLDTIEQLCQGEEQSPKKMVISVNIAQDLSGRNPVVASY